MPKKRINDDELMSFLTAMKDVKRLKHNKIIPEKTSKPLPKRQLIEPPKALYYFEEDASVPPVSQDEYLSFKKPEISDKLLRKLKKGQYNVQAVLDLHGLTVREAEVALSHFFNDCMLQAKKMVILIHGKGKDPTAPILKNKLNQWLRHDKDVLAFCTASSKHGGTGALYVLLKSSTKRMNFD